VAGRVGISLKFISEFADVRIDRTSVGIFIVAPHGIQYRVPGKRPVCVLNEEEEQVVFARRHSHLIAAIGDNTAAAVDFHIPEPELSGNPLCRTAQKSANAGHQFPRPNGLYNIIVGAHFQKHNPLHLVLHTAEDNGGSLCTRRVQLGAELRSADSVQRQVHKEQLRFQRPDSLKSRLGVRCDDLKKAFFRQGEAQELARCLVRAQDKNLVHFVTPQLDCASRLCAEQFRPSPFFPGIKIPRYSHEPEGFLADPPWLGYTRAKPSIETMPPL
jgi:hypothetical protein